VEVVGRWFGVRGRRFVRPALTLGRKDGEIRALADLDHKPWAAQDGEVWRAVFSVDSALDDAREIELTVAPDIVVALRTKGRKLAASGATLAATQAARPSRAGGRDARAPAGSSPDIEPSSEPRRRPSPSAELERLGARLAAANDALEQERELRAALAKTLEEERTANRTLRTELGQARSELEIAAAAQAEAAEAEAELEAARRELREAQRRHEALTRQYEEATRDLTSRHEEATRDLTSRHEEATRALTGRHDEATQALARRHEELSQAHALLQQELRAHAEALESAREALAEERAESGRLRLRLNQAQEARQQRAGAAPAAARPAAASGEPEPPVSRRAPSRPVAERRPAEPAATQRYDIESITQGLETRTDPAPAPPRRDTRRGAAVPSDPPVFNSLSAERLRPVNPSLRHRTYWFGRLLALLVLLGVIAAVWIVLHSTVLH
jgi:hypothetical protein